MKSRSVPFSLFWQALFFMLAMLFTQRPAMATDSYPACDSFRVTIVTSKCGPAPDGTPGWCCDCQNPLDSLSNVKFTAFLSNGSNTDIPDTVTRTTPGTATYLMPGSARRLDSIIIAGKTVLPDNQEHRVPIPNHNGWCFKVVIGPSFITQIINGVLVSVPVCPMNIDICMVRCQPCPDYELVINVNNAALLPIVMTNNWSDGGVTTNTYTSNGIYYIDQSVERPGSPDSITTISSLINGITSITYPLNPIPSGRTNHIWHEYVPNKQPCFSMFCDTVTNECGCLVKRITIASDSCDHSIYGGTGGSGGSGGGGSLGEMIPAPGKSLEVPTRPVGTTPQRNGRKGVTVMMATTRNTTHMKNKP